MQDKVKFNLVAAVQQTAAGNWTFDKERGVLPGRCRKTTWIHTLLGVVLLFASSAQAEDPFVIGAEERQRMEQVLPAKATVQPAKSRRLLIFSRNVGYGGHRSSRAYACEALTTMGKKTGAFETTISEDPAVFHRKSLQQFDAVFLNNTIGNTLTDPELRKNLLEFVTGGGGLMGVHGTSIAFMDWQWPPIESWPEFGNMIGARGAYHRDDKEHVWIKIDEPSHPLSRAFGGQGFERHDEFFRFHEPYSRQLDRVLLSMDVAKTDLSGIKPDEHLLREDKDYAIAWIRNYGRGRVFYCSLAHSDSVFVDPKMLQFYLDAAQFILGDLDVPTTPSAKLSPAVLAQEKLGWRLGVEAYTFHKFTFFETIEKTAELGLPYIGGLSFMQQVSKDIPKSFDQNLTDDELRAIRLKMDSAGVRLLTYYAQDIPGDEAGCRKLFEFGRKMGFETFMCEPKPEQLDRLDKLANEYGINVAIHNHGQNISPLYWNPEGVLKACEGRSKRIGAAPDLGYWLRSGIDPIEAVRVLKDRIITVQMHDLHELGGNGHDVPWGKGIGKLEEIFRELHRQGINPTMIGLEFSHNFTGSMPDVVKCVEFFNATTLKLAAETPIPAASAETVKDADGNIYHTVKIGNQIWTIENLKTTKFNDGTPIPNVTDDAGWKGLASPGFCYYENKPENGKKYGALYNWWAASSDKIAPKGWRVPTHEEQMSLQQYLISNGYNYDGTKEGNKVAKSMAAKTDWIYKATDEGGGPVSDTGTVGKDPETNNRTGFSALPAGSRWNDGSFHALGTSQYWWSVTPDGESIKAHMSSVHTWFAKYGNNQHHKRSGFSIRLIRDASDQIPTDGLKLWFRADRGVTHSDNKVSQWDDQSGSNLHAKLDRGQPMLLPSAIGGQPAIHLNGKGDTLKFSGWTPNGLTEMTLITVSANTEFQPEPYKGGWDEGGHCGTLQSVLNWPEQQGTGPGAWGNVIISAFQKSVSYRFGTGQKSNSNNWKRPACIGDAPTLTTAIHDGATEKVYVEGELVWTQTDKLTTIKNTADYGYIGRWSHGGDNSGWFLGNVAEIIVYTRALSDAERKQVEDYLKAKYFANK